MVAIGDNRCRKTNRPDWKRSLLGPLCKSSRLDTSYDATSLFDFPSFFYLSKGQEREAYQYNKLHIDRGKYQEKHRAQTGEWIC